MTGAFGEPWGLSKAESDGASVVVGDRREVVALTYGAKRRENARRIAACVNALAGIPTEAIEQMPADVDGVRRLQRPADAT